MHERGSDAVDSPEVAKVELDGENVDARGRGGSGGFEVGVGKGGIKGGLVTRPASQTILYSPGGDSMFEVLAQRVDGLAGFVDGAGGGDEDQVRGFGSREQKVVDQAPANAQTDSALCARQT